MLRRSVGLGLGELPSLRWSPVETCLAGPLGTSGDSWAPGLAVQAVGSWALPSHALLWVWLEITTSCEPAADSASVQPCLVLAQRAFISPEIC